MSRYRPLKPGEKRPCWFCGGRGTILENDRKTRKVVQVPCPKCKGSGKQ